MSVQRQVWPLQCTAEPPTTSPGRNEPRRRIGSASCEGLLRTVRVSRAVFCMRSWRTTKRSSSRTIGTAKSLSVLRMSPRSRATTFSPASVNSFARMPPVQPSPTMTASTSFNLVTMSSSLEPCHLSVGVCIFFALAHDPSGQARGQTCPKSRATFRDHALAHVRDAYGIVGEFLVAIFFDVLPMHRDRSGESDQPPARLVAVAAVDRVREHAFHYGLIQRGPEHAHG